MAIENDSWTDLVPSVVKPVVYAYKYRKSIHEYWKKAQIKVGKGSPNVIITGRAGVGKSVLASHYHGEANSLDWREPGTSSDVEIKPITIGDWTKIVAVIPGQNSAERAKSLDYSLNQTDDLEGVIHVVDWGYTTIRDTAVKKDMVEERGFDSVKKVRQHNMNLELEDFKSMLEKISMSIASGRGPKWLVIAVNKIDLFESDLEQARQYYHPSCSGLFPEKIGELYQSIGKNNLKVICLPVCSMPEPFLWNGEVISSEIDSVAKQRNYLRCFIDNIALLQNGL